MERYTLFKVLIFNMKVNLYVDLAYAFDFLSILQVKADQLQDDISLNNFNYQKDYIEKQVKPPLFKKIIDSKEYENLYSINKNLWDSINLIKTKKITAKYIDDLNYQRWIIKNKLQKRFFKTKTSEQKTKRK